MKRSLAIGFALLSSLTSFAQTPEAKTAVTAEGTEVVRYKPEGARLTLVASVKNPDSTAAADESHEIAKKFADAAKKLKVENLKVQVLPLKIGRAGNESSNIVVAAPGGGAAPAPPKDFVATRMIVVTVTNGDFAALSDAIDKVQREALRLEVEGEKKNTGYNPFGTGDNNVIKVNYFGGTTTAEDDLHNKALTVATKKAVARAEKIAEGLGLKLGAVQSASEVPVEAAKAEAAAFSIYGAELPKEQLVDGELTHTVKVKVVFAASK